MKHVLCSITFLGILIAQDVSEIIISGNNVTKNHIIYREIHHPIHVPLDKDLAQKDRDRIENLGIFSLVEWQAIPLEDGTVRLKYNVIESSRIFPGIFPLYEEDTGWSFAYGLIVKNFRGRNETLSLGGVAGGVNAYGVEFNNPWIIGDHVSVSLQVGKQFSDHLFLPFEQHTSSFEINLGRYFGYKRRVSIGVEFETNDYVGDSSVVTFEYIAPQTSLFYDTRDIYSDPSKGVYFTQYIQLYSFSNRGGQSMIWNQSYSLFFSPINGKRKTTLGFNVQLNSTHGDYHRELLYRGLGGAYSIRGWNIETRELFAGGEQPYRFGYFQFVSSFEVRQTLIPRFAVQQKTMIGNMKTEFGLQAIIFIDAGTTGDNWRALRNEIPMLGAGVGLRLPLAMVGNLRFDYGWSFYNRKAIESSFHFSLGQKF